MKNITPKKAVIINETLSPYQLIFLNRSYFFAPVNIPTRVIIAIAIPITGITATLSSLDTIPNAAT